MIKSVRYVLLACFALLLGCSTKESRNKTLDEAYEIHKFIRESQDAAGHFRCVVGKRSRGKAD